MLDLVRFAAFLSLPLATLLFADPVPREARCMATLGALFTARLGEPFCGGGSCVENIRDFTRRLKGAGVSLEGARVLYLRRQDGRTFGPDAARNGKGTKWRHHAVLLVDGMIYDFDFAPDPKEKTKPVPVAKYFEAMMGTVLQGDRKLRSGQHDRIHEVHVVEIPAEDAAQPSLPKAPSDYPETPLVDYVAALPR